ncbi:MAG: helix-turn-helix transcriptional regulator [Sedimenticola sp.]
MNTKLKSPAAIAEELGKRLKQARLNTNLTQVEVAGLAGVSRKVLLNAEKGKVQLEALVAIMVALNLTGQLDRFLPKQDISPIQLAKLQGKKRQRASGRRKMSNEEPPEW